MKSLISNWSNNMRTIGGIVGCFVPPVATFLCGEGPEYYLLALFASPPCALLGMAAGGIIGSVCGLIDGYIKGFTFNIMDYYEPNSFYVPPRFKLKYFREPGESPYVLEYPIIY